MDVPVSSTTLSVVICTHNRANDVIENVSALAPQIRNKPVEIIVIDSASNLVEARALDHLSELEGAQLIRLDRAGLSLARNTGMARARGIWVAFLDDDVIVKPDWVDAALRRIASSTDDIAIVAGRVLPRWPQAIPDDALPPEAIGPRWKMLLSVVDDPRVYCSTLNPIGVGANYMVRKSALEVIGGFPTALGRLGDSLASGEDAYVMDRVIECGLQTWYDGTIAVEHKIHAIRLTRSWIADRARHEGAVDLRKKRSLRKQFVKAVKCAASLPILGIMRHFDDPASEYAIRFHHDLGLLRSYIHVRGGLRPEV
jgi:glycosyltransferase involved in cell wall biosynthesis